VKAQATLVGAEGRVELDTEATVDVRLAGVVLPRHAEDDLPLGSQMRSMVLSWTYSGCRASTGASDSTTSRTAW